MNLKEYKTIAQKIGKEIKCKSASLSFLNINDKVLEHFCCITFSYPDGKELYVNILNTEQGIMTVHFFMSKYYLFKAAQEEINAYPDGYKIYQDDNFAYIVTPLDINSVTEKTTEQIFLSEKTHCFYEKISDYIENYENCRMALEECIEKKEEQKYIDYFKSEYSIEKQILEPLSKACSIILNKPKYAYTFQNGMYIIALMEENSFEQTGICLNIETINNEIVIKKITGKNEDNSFKTIIVPNNVVDFVNIMSTRTLQKS